MTNDIALTDRLGRDYFTSAAFSGAYMHVIMAPPERATGSEIDRHLPVSRPYRQWLLIKPEVS